MTRHTIPEIRERMHELAAESRELATRMSGIASEMDDLAEQTRRRFFGRAKDKSQRVTPATAASIRTMAAAYPDMHHQDIADAHGVNLGRVSEILHGAR